jgi:YD repeat-containing protein
VTTKTNANNAKILEYGYDANNRLTHRWSLAKLDTWYGYDQAGNLTNIDYNASPDIRYKYDVLNRLTNMVDAVGTTTWTYDSANRYMVERAPWTNADVTVRWNTVGLRTNLNILQPSNSFNVNYSYDTAKRLYSVASTSGTFTYAYNPGLNSLTTASKLVDRLDLPNTSYITNNGLRIGKTGHPL